MIYKSENINHKVILFLFFILLHDIIIDHVLPLSFICRDYLIDDRIPLTPSILITTYYY